jgi:hypothetical protein
VFRFLFVAVLGLNLYLFAYPADRTPSNPVLEAALFDCCMGGDVEIEYCCYDCCLLPWGCGGCQ